MKFVHVHLFIVSGRHAGQGRKQRQQASESLARQYQVGTRFLGYKRRPVLIVELRNRIQFFSLRYLAPKRFMDHCNGRTTPKNDSDLAPNGLMAISRISTAALVPRQMKRTFDSDHYQ